MMSKLHRFSSQSMESLLSNPVGTTDSIPRRLPLRKSALQAAS